MACVTVGIALQIILMFGFRLPEVTDRLHLGYDLTRPIPRRIDVFDGVQGNLFLFVVGIIDGRSVGGPTIIALPVQCGGIMDLEE